MCGGNYLPDHKQLTLDMFPCGIKVKFFIVQTSVDYSVQKPLVQSLMWFKTRGVQFVYEQKYLFTSRQAVLITCSVSVEARQVSGIYLHYTTHLSCFH